MGYRFGRTGHLDLVVVDDERQDDIELISCAPDLVVLDVAGVEKPYRVHLVCGDAFVDGPDGSSVLSEIERFPQPGSVLRAGALIAPLPGTVIRVPVSVGERVRAGETLVAIEAMKMEHEVHAQVTGTVSEIHVSTSDQVEAGKVLVVVEPEES